MEPVSIHHTIATLRMRAQVAKDDLKIAKARAEQEELEGRLAGLEAELAALKAAKPAARLARPAPAEAEDAGEPDPA